MTTRAISLPLSCFIYRLSEPKPIEKWSTFIKINEESFSNLKKRFVIDGYGGFQDKARECGIEKLNFSFGVNSPGHIHFWILDDVTNMDVVVGPRGNPFITLIRALATLFPRHIP